ncbi:type 2 lanthipeptide synthetase LanM family protein [Bacillus sp. Marseille-P3800]|uniref:type 2 lanthipeptide synthetase LanM family protein n=1 Tax=Bacillus sp. Marseille-P3800 TaxID=2014782 RepID=UPI000C06C113|nr:type 2 lanthipeptide synthetase LanM family protein [Bacillus sp. Marseille-P3800]
MPRALERDRINKLLQLDEWKKAVYLEETIHHNTVPKTMSQENASAWADSSKVNLSTLKKRLSLANRSFIDVENHPFDRLDTSIEQFSWFKTLQTIFQTDADRPILSIHVDAFEPFFQPFQSFALHQLTSQHSNVSSSFSQQFSDELCTRLFQLSVQTLVYEVVKNRINGTLQGETPEERYHDFLAYTLTEKQDILSFLTSYPVLSRLLCEETTTFIEGTSLLLSRLQQDQSLLFTHFSIEEIGVKSIEYLGDPHKDGERAALILFNSGQKLMYKPRSLAIDQQFQSVLTWFNEHMTAPLLQLKAVTTVDCEKYGWQQYIKYESCLSQADLHHFYTRAGSLLSLIYALNGTDFHYENVLAAGAHPYLIDLEGLFSPQIDEPITAANNVMLTLNQSVLGSNLLPNRFSTKKQKQQLSGVMPSIEGIKKSRTVLKRGQTDENFLTKEVYEEHVFKNLPSYNGAYEPAHAYIADFINGFTHTYNLLLQKKHSFLRGPIAGFKPCLNRVIYRNTEEYQALRLASRHPKYLMDAIDRQQLFDHVWRLFKQEPSKAHLFFSESTSLLTNHIPFFQSRVDDTELLDANGIIVFSMHQSGQSLVEMKINQLSQQDLTTQLHFIHDALTTEKRHPLLNDVRAPDRINQAVFPPLALARQIGDLLIQTKKTGMGGDVSWIDARETEDGFQFDSIRPTLYDGLIGIAVFFSYLHKETGEQSYLDMLNELTATISDQIDNVTDPSAFFGKTGILYLALVIYRNQQDDVLISVADAFLHSFAIQESTSLDYLNGYAGTLAVLVEYNNVTGSQLALKRAKQLGDFICEDTSTRTATLSLSTGFSHGKAGVAYALSKLYRVTKEPKYKDIAYQLIQEENSHYNPADMNWVNSKTQRFDTVQWCHGATGIGLGRLKMYEHLEDAVLLEDIHHAIEKTTAFFSEIKNHSLCHGFFGNIELLQSYHQHFNRKIEDDVVQAIMADVCAAPEFKPGLPLKTTPPGLMLGYAGFGYGLLRIHNQAIPSVLMLE